MENKNANANEESCGCGHEHHEHNNSCGCGHEHHEHNNSCGCGDHKIVVDANLTENQISFLLELEKRKYLPVVQFVVKSTSQENFESVALQPVFIRSVKDTMEEVKESGQFLLKLENQGMITLDYDIKLNGYAYDEYKKCELYKYFCDTIIEGKLKENFKGDIPSLELGSMGLTDEAVEILNK